MELHSKLATVDVLDEQVLMDLFNLKYIAVRVPRFYNPVYAKSLSELLYKEIDDAVAAGIYESNVDSYWSVAKDKQRRERYLNAALPLQRRMRRFSAPHPSPIDLLRVTLDEIWPGGAGLMHLGGRKTPFGATRLWRTNSEALPHQDVLRREQTDDTKDIKLLGQIGVNIYLDVAEEGGGLEAWDHVITDEEYHGLGDRYEGSYGYKREMLPEQSVVIPPQVGDLVLINTAYVHAVRKITAGHRITVSGFVGNCGLDQPLRCWS